MIDVFRFKRLVDAAAEGLKERDEMREALLGVRVGRSIEDALPSELAACGDEDIGTLFDLKFIEGQMLCFEKTGEDRQRITERKKVMRKVDEKLGPVIICVDTSGSMQGEPEVAAKAVALTLALQARRENRFYALQVQKSYSGIFGVWLGQHSNVAEVVKNYDKAWMYDPPSGKIKDLKRHEVQDDAVHCCAASGIG